MPGYGFYDVNNSSRNIKLRWTNERQGKIKFGIAWQPQVGTIRKPSLLSAIAAPDPHYIYAPPLTVINLPSHTEMEQIKWISRHKILQKTRITVTSETKDNWRIKQNTHSKIYSRFENGNASRHLKSDLETEWQVRKHSETPLRALVSPRTSARGECVQPFITTFDYYGAIKHSAHTRNWGNNKTKLTYKTTPWTNSESSL